MSSKSTPSISKIGDNIKVTQAPIFPSLNHIKQQQQLQQQQLQQQISKSAQDLGWGQMTSIGNTIQMPPEIKGVKETGPHPFLDDMEVWTVHGKKYTHYTFSHICPDMQKVQPNGIAYGNTNVRPAVTPMKDKCVCIECGEEFPEYKKLVTMWKMKSIGDSRKNTEG